ncbi:protein kinase, putative [Trypanosoma equiperdum]|uniref:Protein kinase, putative n=3 Tax=Trypanozoon TaxID=39700 RepID=Q57VI9_TRYB2|nr:protein kinase, putative [Trypanosoma brucei gambiense DAL972]XP_846245.1 protein kinase, putative [Trypanosoma brucei brucei TREU927]AAX70380.1 protein kinase, putative [Trypanosoma brucei]SCU64666.1 protein kinase, putative [Trypanosoma equiperdum]AAZ12686.1 protein kinase, putative [Trypanosoma brucei brucei TREU927]CBH12832.1 protein kinase, putative [Trypanosoma brucei gambiense DAL972]|eukprot:XP_011775111.1 protein kinase, putative [Trypanosoma brucei gambiense DAL972]
MDFHSLQSTLTEARALASSSKTVSFDHHYELLEELGKGAYGTVWKCCRRHDSLKRPYGVKIINKREAGAKGLRSVMGEVETMSLLSHPNIVRLEETFHDDQTLWIVMEYMAGGELQRALKRDGSFSEVQTRRITMQLLFALEFIHQKGIVHRDLKPENCLLSEGDLVCKISDFGFAVLVGVDQCLMSFCGTTVFMAPEIFSDTNYGKPVDMWALGVMVYLMFTGEYPFLGRTQKETTEAILKANYNMKDGKISEGSSALHDFISKLLVVDPNRRYSAREALKHPWIKLGMNMEIPDDEPKAPKRSGLRPRGVFRALSIAIMAAHRLLYLRYCRMLDSSDCGNCAMLRNFTYVVSGRYEPPCPSLECSGVFLRHPRGLPLLLPMVEVSRTLESLDLSNNNIFNLTFLQQLVKVVGNHPSLVSLNLSNNPIPALAGRGLLRLARSPQSRLTYLGLEGTQLSAEALAQISSALKERLAAAPTLCLSMQSCTGPRPLEQVSPTQSRSARTTRSRSQHGSAHTSLMNPSRSPQSKGPRLPPINSKRRNER